jgi:hypothetical protein
VGSYQDPEFAFDARLHEANGLEVLTGDEDPTGEGAGVFRVVDSQHARPAKILATGSNPIQIEVNRGSNSAPNHTRLIIPAGHNLDGWDVRLLAGALSGGTDAVAGPFSIVSDDEIDITYAEDPDGALNFQIVKFESSPAPDLTIELPEIYLTNTVVPIRGPDTTWGAVVRRNVQDFTGASGVGTSVRTGADQQTWRLTWNLVLGDDVDDFLRVLESTVRPFYFLPPDDDFGWALYKLEGNVDKREKFRSSTVGPLVYEATALLVETLG